MRCPLDPVSRNCRRALLQLQKSGDHQIPAAAARRIRAPAHSPSFSTTPGPPYPRRRSRIPGGARGKPRRELRAGRFPVDDDASTSYCAAFSMESLQSPRFLSPIQQGMRTRPREHSPTCGSFLQ
ncbi:uncharacterized protein LOC124680761 [Lolium rigidum]|uniref:uncharacterized protein LOC124680761 n=1 Tax=Lolium rigidum TaxID=89674 RepID=UPI001F5D920A|nr:uncharacterized protein LOC124680761 [Lolium rigidum]